MKFCIFSLLEDQNLELALLERVFLEIVESSRRKAMESHRDTHILMLLHFPTYWDRKGFTGAFYAIETIWIVFPMLESIERHV